jgi:hypothetical protein
MFPQNKKNLVFTDDYLSTKQKILVFTADYLSTK